MAEEKAKKIAAYELLWNQVKDHDGKYWIVISSEIGDEPHTTAPSIRYQRWYSAGFKKFVAALHGDNGEAYEVAEKEAKKIAPYVLLWNKVKEHEHGRCWTVISREICDEPHALPSTPQALCRSGTVSASRSLLLNCMAITAKPMK